MKFTEGVQNLGYALAKRELTPLLTGDKTSSEQEGIIIKDVIADAFLQQIYCGPRIYVIATLNLNGDHISTPGGPLGYRDCPRRKSK
jgi:isocitrate dehydrogenase